MVVRSQQRGIARRANILKLLALREHSSAQRPPTIREIARGINCSVAMAHHHVMVLADQHQIVYEPGKRRTIRLPDDAKQ